VFPVVRTYADTTPGSIVALTGSSGFVEVAQRDGDAARTLGVTRGAPVVLRAPASAPGA
jgi:S-adenosylmethionine hydrolase